MSSGQFSTFEDVAIIEALRTPWSDLNGPLAQVSPIDLGIKAVSYTHLTLPTKA